MKGRVPQETTRFVGRRPEPAWLEALLAAHRLTAPTGAGGVDLPAAALASFGDAGCLRAHPCGATGTPAVDVARAMR